MIVGDGMFVHGVQICTTDHNQTSKRRLKGVRLFGATFDKTSGAISVPSAPTGGHASYQLPNCDAWAQKVSCPNDRLATGLVYHVNDDGSLFGLGLRCSKIKQE